MRNRLRLFALVGDFVGFESVEALHRLRQAWITACLAGHLHGTPSLEVERVVLKRHAVHRLGLAEHRRVELRQIHARGELILVRSATFSPSILSAYSGAAQRQRP